MKERAIREKIEKKIKDAADKAKREQDKIAREALVLKQR